MFEERADECRATNDCRELHRDAIGQTFTLLQWSAGMARVLGMTPDQLIRVEIGGIAGQIMQRQLAVEPRDVLGARRGFVRR